VNKIKGSITRFTEKENRRRKGQKNKKGKEGRADRTFNTSIPQPETITRSRKEIAEGKGSCE